MTFRSGFRKPSGTFRNASFWLCTYADHLRPQLMLWVLRKSTTIVTDKSDRKSKLSSLLHDHCAPQNEKLDQLSYMQSRVCLRWAQEQETKIIALRYYQALPYSTREFGAKHNITRKGPKVPLGTNLLSASGNLPESFRKACGNLTCIFEAAKMLAYHATWEVTNTQKLYG